MSDVKTEIVLKPQTFLYSQLRTAAINYQGGILKKNLSLISTVISDIRSLLLSQNTVDPILPLVQVSETVYQLTESLESNNCHGFAAKVAELPFKSIVTWIRSVKFNRHLNKEHPCILRNGFAELLYIVKVGVEGATGLWSGNWTNPDRESIIQKIDDGLNLLSDLNLCDEGEV